MADKATLVKAVKDHAHANYDFDGWDYLIECWEDKDILEAMGEAETPEQAIANCHKVVFAMDEQRQEAQAAGEW